MAFSVKLLKTNRLKEGYKDTYEDNLYNFISLSSLCMPHNFLTNASNWISSTFFFLHVVIDYFVKHACFADARTSQKHDLELKMLHDVIELCLLILINIVY